MTAIHTKKRCLVLATMALSTLAAVPASGQTINEELVIAPTDAQNFISFGQSVAISGTTAIIGAPLEYNAGINSGSAYLFDMSTGQQLFELTPPDAEGGMIFGNSVAISGTTAIVGAPNDSDENPVSGSAYVYDTITGQQLFKLTASDSTQFARFGYSVAISGTTAIIGAESAGAAYLFDTTTGQELFKLAPNDVVASDSFGTSAAISGTTAIVGSYRDDDAGSSSGSAYVFDTTTGQLLFKLVASDAAENDQFGYSVSISGNTAVIGANRDDDEGSYTGSAYIFDTTTGQQLFKIAASDAAENDQFGYSVAIAGTTAVIGARESNNAEGSAYLFDTTTGQQRFKLAASDAESGALFGSSVAISGAAAIVGATQASHVGITSGSVYSFPQGPGVLNQLQPVVVTEGETAGFTIVPIYPNVDQYQWRRDGVDLVDGAGISGAQSDSLEIVSTMDDVGLYDCVLTNAHGQVISNEAVLAVRSDPNACEGDLNGDGSLDFFDVQQFIVEFQRGCP
ncbi:MAG: hypothetical protein CMJ35_03285 [Phycisphaerae bacterium]|nr:hypothetical protein [Phycisphaerae bacterium]MBM90623.1 hypothetical protein [Phycisphaerae bacterium]